MLLELLFVKVAAVLNLPDFLHVCFLHSPTQIVFEWLMEHKLLLWRVPWWIHIIPRCLLHSAVHLHLIVVDPI